jgi:uncharacterized cupredoxin-like copper-binding protein
MNMMKLTRRTWLATAVAPAAAVSSGAAMAKGTVVKVSLWDQGPMSMNMLGQGHMMGMGQGVPNGSPMRPMGIKVSTSTVRAGEVSFEVVNDSKQMIHEMVISPTQGPSHPLPYVKAENKVDEDAAGHLGKVAELEPGQSGALRLTLKPGRCILYCNIAGHYELGMWTLLTVTA